MKYQLTDLCQIEYSNGKLEFMRHHPVRIKSGVYIIVISGEAVFNTGATSYRIKPQTELSFINGGVFQCSETTDDFMARMLIYDIRLLDKIAMPIDHQFFVYNEEHPVYIHTQDDRSQRTWREVMLWFDMAEMLFGDTLALKFPRLQEEAFLQGFWTWNFGTIQERIDADNVISSAQVLAHRFIRLVKESVVAHHDVLYFSSALNITPRYLSKIVRKYFNGCSPKEVIDSHLIAEIKERLMDAPQTVTQIAEALNFPDQSYLSRFFQRHTDMSPTQYRKTTIRQ